MEGRYDLTQVLQRIDRIIRHHEQEQVDSKFLLDEVPPVLVQVGVVVQVVDQTVVEETNFNI
jgi:hypothetical protein